MVKNPERPKYSAPNNCHCQIPQFFQDCSSHENHLSHKEIDNLIPVFPRADNRRLSELNIKGILPNHPQRNDQIIEFHQIVGFKYGQEVHLGKSGRMVKFPFDRFCFCISGLRIKIPRILSI